ncbi:amidohydrolase [Georgenia satyanarayanai]|uniref:amidohydrolase n=1 Tax=Georgenia satyanarayanai TaxID=860221 RepID=UPI002041EECF|nr:amidohydrolase [Georgenia satyanarayanai]MCM3660689.1 amidohydrolase [Georgenia satyanarayanai]
MKDVPQADRIVELAAELEQELVAIRRQIHANPELGWMEQETTTLLFDRLTAAGLSPRRTKGSGLVCDIGPDPRERGRRRIALRGDIDALPVPETTGLPFRSRRQGVSHACGHDVHASAVLGAGLILARLEEEGQLPVGVRLILQPAEEVQPSGARELLDQGVLDGVEQIYALHCAPKIACGKIGSRIGPITAASDNVTVTVRSAGGHTSRPHLTGDVVYALGHIITQLPAVLDRRLDPRSGANLTWGAVNAGRAPNTIPSVGSVTGTLRSLDVETWERAGTLVDDVVADLLSPLGVEVELKHQRGMPPVVNDEQCVRLLDGATREVVADDAVVLTEQSLGGEDFAWYLSRVPGAMVRLGTRAPGGAAHDLHQGDLVVDERAISIGARVLARTAQRAGYEPRVAAQPRPGSRGGAPVLSGRGPAAVRAR